jgi:hypothetical protein
MRLVVTLAFALLVAPLAAPVASAIETPGADHSCCPQPAAEAGSTAPCQYLAPLGCCDQLLLPGATSNAGPAPRLLPAVAALSETPALRETERAEARRADHGPPEAPYLRAIVLQL